MSPKEFALNTRENGFYSITNEVTRYVESCGVSEGVAVIYCPHTTAGITINENADPDVVSDMTLAFDRISPNLFQFRHSEGNSNAHVKSTLTGVSQTLIIHSGRLLLGRWQGIYFAEYDGPRQRRYFVKVIEG